MTNDVRELLARAVAEEPPLTLTRDDALRTGRRTLRRRRTAEATGVVAAVLVAAVGVLTLPGGKTPPAATTTTSEALTQALYATGVFTPAQADDEAAFRPKGTLYEYAAVLTTTNGTGHVTITVDKAPPTPADCTTIPATMGQCEVRQLAGGEVVVSTWNTNGNRTTFVLAARKDGTRVAATVTNTPRPGNPKTRNPPLTDDAMCALALEEGLSVN